MGYSYREPRGERHASPQVFQGDLPVLDGTYALSFLDLLEARVVNSFRRAGVSWATLRRAHEQARKLVRHEHPFSTGSFQTDGRRIFQRIVDDAERGEDALVELLRNQYAFVEVVEPYLRNIEFARAGARPALRWWPLGADRHVVNDPVRNFGEPIVDRSRIPTIILAKGYHAEGSIEIVARWYRASRDEVKDAVDYEQRLAEDRLAA
jgi:uncharacterized protein (DUF433 family)